jgi:hypothetical protein
MNKQRGVSLLGLLLISAVLIAVVIIGFKLFPAYTEYLTINKVVNEIARNPEQRGSVKEIQASFDRRAAIDNIKAVGGKDLDIGKQGDRVTIRATWSVKVPLFYNVSACLDFDAVGQQ